MTRLEGTLVGAYYAHRLHINKIAYEHLERAMQHIIDAGNLILNGKVDVQFALDSVNTLKDELNKLITEDSTAIDQLSGNDPEVDYD